ncbi:MAG: 4Fe-4S dicluster domain-containing protein [Bacillota bacterium]|nr:4Fe-4S dicluster domain-containing protein [Bacillota bacterium]
MDRRDFIKRSMIASAIIGGTTAGIPKKSEAAANPVVTVIDLTKCDGCSGEEMPKCMKACKTKNQHRYPQPVSDIQPYWPQKKYEDWQDKKEITSRLTPYNWIFVQKVKVDSANENIDIYLPRRCMHCDNPACVKLCPFAANEKTAEGPVVIDQNFCLGGAKCRDVCPWDIPQRQAGVGLYLKLAPKFAGGGVMYKCDLCIDLVREGNKPACVSECPRGALSYGSKEEMLLVATKRAKEINGYIYGDKENGGTSTLYVSKVPFEEIEAALRNQEQAMLLQLGVPSSLESAENLVKSVLLAPIIGVFAGGLMAWKTMKGGK